MHSITASCLSLLLGAILLLSLLLVALLSQSAPSSSAAPACIAGPSQSSSMLLIMKRRLRQDGSGLATLDGSVARKNMPSGVDNLPVPGCTIQIASGGNLTAMLAQHSATIAAYQGACDCVICLGPGVHPLGGEPLRLDSSVNRQDGGRVVWTSIDSDRPAVLSGGSRITKWSRCDLFGSANCPGREWHGVWVAQMSDVESPMQRSELPVRQLWVEGLRATRAYTYGKSMELTPHDKGFVSAWPVEKFSNWVENQVEMRWTAETWQQWTEPRCVLVNVAKHVNGTLLEVDPGCWAHVKGAFPGEPRVPTFVDNTPNMPPRPGEFTAAPGHIFYRQPTWKSYAPPVDAWVPTQAQIVAGRDLYNHEFRNIQFRHATFRRPSQPGGFFSHQSMVAWDPEKAPDEPVGAVEVRHSREVVVSECSFINIGAAYALSIGHRSQHVSVLRNHFTQLSGGAVKLGNMNETRAMANTSDASEFDDDMVFEENRLEEIALEFREAAAVFAGFVRRTRISQNTIVNTGYTAISLGWGWYKPIPVPHTFARSNHILRNKIIGIMQGLNDGGCIYTLGPQPESTVEGNYCHGNPAEQTGCIYFDNGSRFFKAKNNVIDRGVGPCVNLQGCCDMPALDVHVSNLWCRNTAMPKNGCAEHNCVLDNATLSIIAPAAEWPPAAQAIIDAAGASSYRLTSVPSLFV